MCGGFAAMVLKVYVVDVCDFAYIWIMIRCAVITLSYCIWLGFGVGCCVWVLLLTSLGGFCCFLWFGLFTWWLIVYSVGLGFGMLLVIHILISLGYSGLLLWLLYGLVLFGFAGFRVWVLGFVLWCSDWVVIFSRVVVYCIILCYIILLLFSYFGWLGFGVGFS